MKSKFISWLSLFASMSTLVCCAIPSLLIVLGMGATLAGFVGAFPQVIWLSQYKSLVFGLSGVLIGLAFWAHHSQRNTPCPVDPELAKSCQKTRVWSFRILLLSASLWLVGAFFAFIAPQLF